MLEVQKPDTDIAQVKDFHNMFIRSFSVCSSLHLMLVTCERLIAIKYTLRYPYIVTKRNIKLAVLAIWTLTFLSEIGRFITKLMSVSNRTLFVSLVMTMYVVFMVSAYIILYRETTRHRKMINWAQQLPQEEVERFTKESKALKTTVFVVGAVTISFLPIALHILASTLNKKHQLM